MAVQFVSGTLSPHQIANLYTTPVEIIPAQGANQQIQIIKASFGRYEGKDGDWAGGGGGDGHNTIAFQYGATPLGGGTPALAPALSLGSSYPMFDDAILLSPSTNAMGSLAGCKINPGAAQDNQSICIVSTGNFINVSALGDTKWSVLYCVLTV